LRGINRAWEEKRKDLTLSKGSWQALWRSDL
jgi:hypothetical protein